MRIYFCVLLTLFLVPACADSLYHNPPSEERAWPFTLELPNCDDFYVLRKIMQDFQNREREYWASDLFINRFDNIKEIGLRSHGQSYTPRRYCRGEGLFGDGLKREIFYNITPDQSVILTGQVIDWCVVGLDRAHVDGPNCRRVTPQYP
jgi:hypothetical protein